MVGCDEKSLEVGGIKLSTLLTIGPPPLPNSYKVLTKAHKEKVGFFLTPVAQTTMMTSHKLAH